MKKKAEDEAEAKAKAEAEAKHEKAKNMIEGFVKAGKIKNESAEKWIAQAEVDFDGIKNLLEELPTTKAANKMENAQGSVTEAELTGVIARTMADARNKFKLN